MLTNFQTIRKQIRRLKELERGQQENAFEFYTKKERLMLDRERIKLDKYLAGVKDMGRLPGAIFVIDAKREIIAVREAAKLGIPIIAITDTNADPDLIDFPVPGNDDAIRSVSLITHAIAESISVASKEVPDSERRRIDDLEATTYSTETGETTEKQRPQRRRPKRKRRPRPDVIAQHLGSDDRVASTADEEKSVAETESEDSAQDEGLGSSEASSKADEVGVDPDVPIAVEDAAKGEKDE